MPSHDVLVLGAGPAGLACRAGLGATREVTTLERAAAPGGLLRVFPVGPYVFDTTVHVLFFARPALRAGLLGLLPDGAYSFTKENLVWQRGVTVGYPYQWNAWALPAALRAECLARFLEPQPATPVSAEASFAEWLHAQFGAGFYEHFFKPYNEKLYGVPLDTLAAGPMVWTIPADNREAVVRGAVAAAGERPSGQSFYPRGKSGIQAIPDALLAAGVGPVAYGCDAVRIDPAARVVVTSDGERHAYRDLVSTLPLPSLLRQITALPPDLVRDLEELRASAVTVVQIGARATGDALPAHWTYFPDPEVPFYRLVRLERISPDLAPPGGCALLLECGGLRAPDRAATLELLVRLGVLRTTEIDHWGELVVPCAYVLFRPGHAARLARIRAYLSEVGIRSVGRYGRWEYANMEQTIASGLEAALELLPVGARRTELLERCGIGGPRELQLPQSQ